MTARLRILFLAPQPFFEVRGTPLAVLAMVRALAALGHQVDLLTYAQGAPVDVPGVRHRPQPAACRVGRVRAGPSLAKLALDVPFMAAAAWRMAARPLRRRARGRGGRAPGRAARAPAAACPWWWTWTRPSPTSSATPASRARGPLLWAAEALEGHALRHARR